MSSITIQNLRKRFGQTVALDGLSLHIEDREFVVMVGPTGAGKTTTLRCVAGLERPDEGAVLFDGQDMARESPSARDVAFVFQDYALYPRKTVFENIRFPLVPRGLAEGEIRSKVEGIAEMLRIRSLLDRYPGQLSGGEQQRVALGRAMVRAPRAFLMDEPLTNLDFQLRARMRSELKRIQRELNITFFYVTNDQVEALSMGDRIAVLHEGHLQQIGTSDEIYSQPANLFVARFIGRMKMNFLRCGYRSDQGLLEATDGSWSIELDTKMRGRARRAQNPDDLVLGIRPEDVSLLDGDREGHLRGSVYVLEPLGDCNVVDVAVGSAIVKIKTPPTQTHAVGSEVEMAIDQSRAHLFDGTTGLALRAEGKAET